MLNEKADIRRLDYAYGQALKSQDPRAQVGAIVCSSTGLTVSYGFNDFPSGIKASSKRWQRPTKYKWVEHAERNAIYAAARDGCKTRGGIMYSTWAPCADCARAIIQAGIIEVVTHDCIHYAVPPDWQESMLVGSQMLEEAGVLERSIVHEFGYELRFNGERVTV